MLKYFLALFLLSTCAIAFSPKVPLGPKECSKGPSFWCENIKNAKDCNAVKHCIQTVWELQTPLLDNNDDDNICGLCKAMVKDARSQLESNETLPYLQVFQLENQEELIQVKTCINNAIVTSVIRLIFLQLMHFKCADSLFVNGMIKDVFERSCKLIMLKPVVKQCIKFADEYAVELVDMLDSYMSPDIICTLAGLCSDRGFKMMYGYMYQENLREKERNAELQKDCESCMDLAEYIADLIEQYTPEEAKIYLKERCNYFGSFTLGCANIMDEVIPAAYKSIAEDYTPAAFCHLTSACVNGYGRRIQVKTESDYGVIHIKKHTLPTTVRRLNDDEVCELCETMMQRLVDVLVSNTTAVEFKEMVKGICKQTGKFEEECLVLTQRYIDRVYYFLANDFSAADFCNFLDLCDPPGRIDFQILAPHFAKYDPVHRGGGPPNVVWQDNSEILDPVSHEPGKFEISYGDPMEWNDQLPLERMAVPQVDDLKVNNRESCEFCQYLLHYIQKVISQPYGVNALKKVVDKVCDELPESVTLQCKNFVQEFGDAFVAILAQEIDPSQVCPAVRACPSRVVDDKFEPLEIGGAPGCPLCLMVVEDITEKLKDNKTEDAIRKALHSLCERMSKNLRPECNEFVQKYAEEVVDMMLADFTPQEVCTYLKLCHTKVDVELVAPHPEEKHEILTNEIPREGDGKGKIKVEVQAVEKKNNQPVCFLCEFVMDKVKDQLKDNETEEEVRRIVLGACKSIPKAIESDCRDFVNKYSKYIVEMLENDVDPRMVCREMHMCKERKEPARLDHVFRAVEECAICEALVGAIRGLLEDKNFDRNMSRYAVQICYSIPFLRPYQMDRCRSMVLSYGPSIINLLVELGVRPELVCSRLELCDETEQAKVHLIESSTEATESHPQQRPHLLGGNSCTWGPSYWCQSEDHAKECGTLAHCREVVWKADRPTPAA